MPTGATVPIMIRLTPADAKLLDALAQALNAARPGTVAIALHHLAATLDQGQPIYPTRPLRGPGAGLAALATPAPAMGRVLDAKNARLRPILKSRENFLRRGR